MPGWGSSFQVPYVTVKGAAFRNYKFIQKTDNTVNHTICIEFMYIYIIIYMHNALNLCIGLLLVIIVNYILAIIKPQTGNSTAFRRITQTRIYIGIMGDQLRATWNPLYIQHYRIEGFKGGT